MNALRSRRKGGASGGSSVHQPTDLYKWSVVVSLNPLSALVRTARKCLGSSDWETAYNELRFAKAMQRVEQLKQEGRWSFRQPKKQKGPPVAKSHWDWMLEEMVSLVWSYFALRLAHAKLVSLSVEVASDRLQGGAAMEDRPCVRDWPVDS